MKTSVNNSTIILWRNRIIALIFIGFIYYGLWDFGFSWLWVRISPQFGGTPEIISKYPWIQLYANHFWEIIIALPIIFFVGGKQWRIWSGLTFNNMRESLVIFSKYLIFIIPFSLITQAVDIITNKNLAVSYPLNSQNILGWFSFQLFLSGPAEELLFRGLFQSLLRIFWPGVWRWRSLDIPIAGFISAIIFSFAHINFTIFPFAILNFNLWQLIIAFSFGMFYAIVYYKTGSLLCPMLAHSIGNVIPSSLLHLILLLR